MGDGTDVLDVVKGLALLLAGHTSPWFTRVDPLQDAKAAKVLDGHLKYLETPGPSNEGRLQSSVFLLLLLSHPGKLPFRSHPGVACRLDGLLLRLSLDAVSHDD